MTTKTPGAAPSPPKRRSRVQVPSILQMEVTECGAASLGMILAHYDKYIPLEELRITCGVSRDGANARSIMQGARAYGLQPHAFKREPEDLKSMAFPLIIHWRFAHFLVVEGYYPGGWYLNDPGMGPRTCDDAEFDESFTGVVMQFDEGPDFEPGGKRPGVIGRLINSAGPTGSAFLLAAMIGFLLVIPTLLVPQIVRLYGDQLAGPGGLVATAALVGLMLAATIQGVLLWLQGTLSVRLATKISVRQGSAMVYRLLRLPAEFHAQRGASMLAQRAFLTDQLSVGVSAVTVTASAGILMSVLATIVLILMDLPAGLLAAVLAISTALVLRTSVLRTRDEASRVVREMVEVGSLMSSSLSQIESIKASGNEDGIVARGIAAENRLIEAQQRIGERSMRLTILPMLMGGIGYVLIAAVAAYRVTQGAIDPGSFLAILALSAIVIGPMSQVVLALDQAQTLRASLDQVDDVLETDEDPQFSVVLEGDVPAVLRGELQLQDVSFGYSRLAPPVISEINLHVQPGRRVALVGPSGCGKSTVSRLVTGLYSPWSGEVRIDGRLRLEHSREVLTDDIALVDQNLAIFAGTIRENVTLWDTTVPEEDILAAIQDAQLGEDVARRPGGLDAVLTEGGADLSGGQRQRLEIARALVRNPAVLVMDEATSALDPITEMLIDKAIRRRGITCLVIAHRLSTIRDSDEIVVLSRGVVVERGTHDELMALEGEYQALVGSG